ncbi:MAG: radical SAM protein, partial [Arenicellales bacterium]|nr:radical SAM protein [Arenicellales bacterium]
RFFHQRDKEIRIILGGQGLSVWGDNAYDDLNDVFCFCYGDIDYFGNYIGDLLNAKIPEEFELKISKTGKAFYVLTKFIPDLDSLLLPDWGLLNRHDFNDNYYATHPLPERVSVEERRGCVFRCAFCSYHTLNTHRQKSSERIVEELVNLKSLGYNKVNFTGAEFLAPPRKCRRTLELIIESNLNMDLFGYARIDILHKHPELMDLMAEAGFTATYFGVESGDQSILKAMDKNFNLEKSLPEVLDKLKNYDIDVWASFIFGFPGETEQTITNSTEFIISRNFDALDLHALQVVPGTPLDLNREKYGLKTLGNFWAHPTMSIREIPKLMRKVFVDIYPNCDSSVLHIRDHLGKYFPHRDRSIDTARAIDRCLHEFIYVEFNDSIKTKGEHLLKPWNELKEQIDYIPGYILE